MARARPDVSERNRKIWTGRKHTSSTRAKMKAIKRTWLCGPWSEERKKKHSERMKELGIRPPPEAMVNSAKARKGRPLSEKNRLGISRGRKRHLALPLYGICPCGAHTPPASPTSLELKLRAFLEEFPSVQEQKWFGRYRVDAYLPPPYHLAFEADGKYWYQDSSYEEIRDQFLLEEFSLPVIHLSEEDLWPVQRQ